LPVAVRLDVEFEARRAPAFNNDFEVAVPGGLPRSNRPLPVDLSTDRHQLALADLLASLQIDFQAIAQRIDTGRLRGRQQVFLANAQRTRRLAKLKDPPVALTDAQRHNSGRNKNQFAGIAGNLEQAEFGVRNLDRRRRRGQR